MQDTIMQGLRKELKTAEETLRKMASENILNRQEHTIEHSQIMQDIDTLTRIGRLFGASDLDRHKNDLLQRGENFLPLHSNFKNRHPVNVYIDDRAYPAKYLRDVARITCTYLVREKYKEMVAEVDNFRTIARGDCFASFNREDVACEDPDEIKSLHGNSLYIDSCRMVVNQMGLLRRVLAMVGVDETRIVVEVNENYLRKRREVKVPQRKSIVITQEKAELSNDGSDLLEKMGC